MTTTMKKGMTSAMRAMSTPMPCAMIRSLMPVTVDIMMVGTPTGPKGKAACWLSDR